MATAEVPNIGKLFQNVPEHPESYQAEVKGKIPGWLNGTLLRNGPGIFDIGPDKYDHWFDGLAIIQRYHIHDGKVEYSTKYLESETYERNMRAGRIVVSEFGTIGHPDPCKNIFERYFSHYFPQKFTDNDLVAFVECGDEIYASSETGRLNRVDPKTLDVIGRVDMNKYLAVHTATAHPHYVKDGNTYNMGSSLRSYNIILVPKPETEASDTNGNAFEKSKIVANIKPQSWHLSYYHSFGMSENYIIFPEMPLLMNPWKMICAEFSLMHFASGVEWCPKMQTKLHIVNINTRESVPINYTSEAFFTFHHINAYELNGCIVVDLVAYLDGSIIHDFDLNEMRKGLFPAFDEKKRGYVRRFVFPLSIPEGSKPGENVLDNFEIKTAAIACLTENEGEIHCEFETLFHQGCELPRINYDYNGRMYKYCYAAATPEDSKDFLGSKIVKFDLDSRNILEWKRDHICQYASEPIFVASPNAKEEDDGVLLVPVTNIKPEEENFLLILDAKTLNELARAWIKPNIPTGFHGSYLAS